MKIKIFIKFFFKISVFCMCNNFAYCANNDVSQVCANEIWAYNTKLSDLSEDCQPEILKKIDLHDLITMAEMENNYLMLATDIFNKKFTNRVVKIGENILPTQNNSSYYLSIDDEVLQIDDFNIVFSTLEHFGYSISSLIVIFGNDPDGYLKKSVGFASQHCKNLAELSIAYGKDVLSDVTHPFYNVTKVFFYYSEFTAANTPNLKGIFQNMQRLDLNMIKIQGDSDCFGHSFPKLDHLSITFSMFHKLNDIEESKFEVLIEKNPQIHWLNIQFTTTQIVKFASEHLPNLETIILPVVLKIDYKDEIRFEHVKRFEIGLIDRESFENITFERLEEVNFRPEHFPNWLDFIGRNPNLKKFILHRTAYTVTDKDISLLPKMARNLVEASFSCSFNVQVETIVHLLNECQYIKRLYLHELTRDFVKELKMQISNKWSLEETEEFPWTIFIERK